MANQHGDFIWYELLTTDADAAARFYGAVIGWQNQAAEGSTATTDLRHRTARMWAASCRSRKVPTRAGMRPGWLGYVAVENVDATAADIVRAGGTQHMPPTDIPGVGRFAMRPTRKGSVLRHARRDGRHEHGFDQSKSGHCNWNELATSDPQAALAFYRARFGWEKGDAMPMGEMGDYQFITHQGADDRRRHAAHARWAAARVDLLFRRRATSTSRRRPCPAMAAPSITAPPRCRAASSSSSPATRREPCSASSGRASPEATSEEHSMSDNLVPAEELARRTPVRFPNESAEYRAARTALLAEEIELRRHLERVAAQRRALPPGGEVTGDYRFEGENGPVSFADLFGDKQIARRLQLHVRPAARAPLPHVHQPARRAWKATPPTSSSAWRSPSSRARRSSG